MKRNVLLSWLVLIVLLVTTAIPAYAMDETPGNYVKLDLEKNQTPLDFTSEELSKLPGEAQKFIKDNKDPIIASLATIHVIQEDKDKKGIVVASKNYDFSKKDDIEVYQNDIKELKEKKLSKLSSFDIIQPLAEDNHGGYIVTGLNVTQLSPSNGIEFQLQGYWEWQTTILVSSYDRVGLGWTDSFSSLEGTQLAFGNRYYDGQSITLTKHPYNNPEYFNKGVMWRHQSAYKTYGNVLARIYNGDIGPKQVGIWFEYAAPGGPTSDDSWAVDVYNMVFSYFGYPVPTYIYHFRTFVSRNV
jgi:hypothetical protein